MAISRTLSFILLRNCSSIFQRAAMSSATDVKITKHDNGLATLHMQRAPVNSLNQNLLAQLMESLKTLQDQECKGVILTSNQPKVFSGGLDIMEMYSSSPQQLRDFWTAMQDLFVQLYSSEMATVALINGHAPGSGCLLSMCCDYRIMIDGPYNIGFNETKFGAAVPAWYKNVAVGTIGQRSTELMMQLGLQYSVIDALKIGMIDQIGPSLEEAEQMAMEKLVEFVKVPVQPRHFSKLLVRQEVLQKFSEEREADTDQFVSFFGNAAVRKSLRRYIETLKKKI